MGQEADVCKDTRRESSRVPFHSHVLYGVFHGFDASNEKNDRIASKPTSFMVLKIPSLCHLLTKEVLYA